MNQIEHEPSSSIPLEWFYEETNPLYMCKLPLLASFSKPFGIDSLLRSKLISQRSAVCNDAGASVVLAKAT